VDQSDIPHIVWNKVVPLKISLFVWRLSHNWVPTKDNFFQRGIIPSNSNMCSSGCGLEKNVNHFLCAFYKSVWSHCLRWLGIHSASSLHLFWSFHAIWKFRR